MFKKQTWITVLSVVLLFCFIFLLFWHAPNPSVDKRNAKLKDYFENAGFSITTEPMDENRQAPIYKPSAWECWLLDGEELLVYFDESNRADYLSARVDPSFGISTRFGLRFVLVYAGQNETILQVLRDIPKDDMR